MTEKVNVKSLLFSISRLAFKIGKLLVDKCKIAPWINRKPKLAGKNIPYIDHSW